MNYKVVSVLMIALSACSSPYQQDMGATTLSPVEKSDKVTLSTLPSRTNLLPGAEKVVVQSLQDLNNAENSVNSTASSSGVISITLPLSTSI